MGRRTLRKVDPSLDLSRHLLRYEQLPRPWDAAAVFGRTAPLHVEVGSGKGLFLRSVAPTQPGVDFLGIEIAQKYARFAAAGLVKSAVANARVLVADAVAVFRETLPERSVAAVHVYFPDPWWKARHKKRRLMQESFVIEVARALQPGGRLHFWTDVEEYFLTSLEAISRCSLLEGPFEAHEVPAEHDMAYRTHFERRMRLHDEPVYRAEFRRL